MKTIRHTAPSLNAELIGELDGENSCDLAVFRGISFASVDKRWTHSQTRHSLESPYDATQFGPRCSQGNGMVLVTGGVNDPAPGDNEFKCLNLNICTPRESLPAQGKDTPLLPVMVWIHGGGFAYGANSVARYRAQVFTSHAKRSGTPVLVVQVNYRLGVLGFASSDDLAQETTGQEAPCRSGNYGFVDQRNALEWVNKHIADFGGDPSNITAFGVSAGSASIHFHILSRDPLFDRAIMMSGSGPVLGPLPQQLHEQGWQNMVSECGLLEVKSSAERLSRLRAMKPEELIEKFSKSPLGPVGDGNLLPETWTFTDEVPETRCKKIMLGDTNIEALVLDHLPENISQNQFAELLAGTFTNDEVEELRSKFGFSKDPQTFEEYRDAVRLLFSAAMFHYPNIGIARAALNTPSKGQDVYLYHFEEVSPFPGATHGLSYHGLCALLIYLNQLDDSPEPTRVTSLEAASLFTAFANGKEPWEPFGEAERFFRFGPDGVSGLQYFESDETRTYEHIEWMAAHWEKILLFVRRLLY
ncbi:alpha/beta-hydrolase [Penicillium odoratum]|uniref:alpha/beta-hydrolase n=1 Tax=Penicillium odoratum TaxID=1167516 RepID=UPI002546FA81|nr:alpha/beta-hydrolase [Penicillium odoratum]KAJ5769634.1 alpha/beta-hydrolase [Penicillium odoratum]